MRPENWLLFGQEGKQDCDSQSRVGQPGAKKVQNLIKLKIHIENIIKIINLLFTGLKSVFEAYQSGHGDGLK